MTQTVDERPQTAEQPSAVDAVRARLCRPMPGNPFWGWAAPALVAALAAVLRLVDLGRPNRIVFDETYYAKDALSLLEFGDARAFTDDADERIMDGNLDVFTDEPSFVVHPAVGKWLIALGIRLVGMEPTGWRLATAIAGIITVFLVARAGRRLFRSTLLGCAAGLFIALDGMSIAVSRTAILDGIFAMFVVAAFACLLVDRDHARRKYADWAAARLSADREFGDGPVFRWRPWRFAAALMIGLACGTKWSGAYVLVVFGLMTVVWEISARRAAGTRSPVLNSLLRDGPFAFLTIVPVAAATYLASWWGWIASADGWGRQWAATNPASGIGGIVPDWLRSLWHYHDQMLAFHTGLTNDHDYASQAWSWLLLARPVSFDYQGLEQGQAGCAVEKCSQEVLALGTPLLWWAACIALVVCLWRWFVNRDWRPGAILAGVVATWVPWFLFWDRTTFAFYAVAIVPFLALAVAYCLGLVIGDARASATRRATGAIVAGGFALAVVVMAWYFYPIHVDQVIPYDDWSRRMWFDNWI